VADAVFTRDHDDCEPYRALLAVLGLDVVAMPVTVAVPPQDAGALARALDAGGHAAIVVTSRRAAAEVAESGRPLPEVWAVGEAAARPLAGAIHPPDAIDGGSLARALIAARSVAGQRILVPRAEHGRTEAIELLRAAGAIVEEVVAYRMEAAPADSPAVAEGRARLVGGAAVCVVFAPSQVAALVDIVGPLPALAARFCAIGHTTAGALRDAGVLEVEVAATPTPEGIARAVRSVYPPRR
jgi:uroporphyrinogen-III synthase